MGDSFTTWNGCYDGSWAGVIVDEAFGHPAKFAYGLINRIFEHGLQRGWWSKNSVCGDPFGGVGLGGIVAAYKGLRWIGVELEPRFCRLALPCDCPGITSTEWVRWHHRAARHPVLCPRCISAIQTVKPRKEKSWFSTGNGVYYRDGRVPFTTAHHYAGHLPTGVPLIQGDSRNFASIVGGLDTVVTSPPYAGTNPAQSSESVDWEKQYETYRKQGGGASFEKFVATRQKHSQGYGAAKGQIGALKEGKLDAVVTSPPYAEDTVHGRWSKAAKAALNGRTILKGTGDYGSTPGQIGQRGETYWEAVAQVYDQCRLALKPGGVLVVVVKDYVKNKQRVPLCDQTHELLLSLGFEPVERIRAMLVKESREPALFGGEHVEKKERKSFFRRLAEKKGSPRIDWEEVLVVRTADDDM